ncbi:MAG: class I SAM-dependent methyltransferase [Candidatus Sabulitectum sp.]|nr:class I SAM-dependent methyltransferase [Candidatus Sabulitectum sp.]
MKYENGEAYDKEKAGNIYYRLWFEMIEHYLGIYLPDSGKVLDAGGGTGEFSIRAANLRSELSFINFDFSENMLNTAKEKLNKLGLESRVRNRQGNIMEMPFNDRSFDYVMCLGDAFSFCSDVGKAFSELARVTGNKGLLHLSVNSFWGNFAGMISKGPDLGFTFNDVIEYYKTRVIQQNGVSTHCRSFTFQELKEMGERNGLKIVKAFSAPVLPAHKDWLHDEERYQQVLELQYCHCEKESLLDMGNHLNIIFGR